MFGKGPDTISSVPGFCGRGFGGSNGNETLSKQIWERYYVCSMKAMSAEPGCSREKPKKGRTSSKYGN